MGALIGCLHGHSIINNLRFEHEANLNPLNAAIKNFMEFRKQNPNYLFKRFETVFYSDSERKERIEKQFNKMSENLWNFEDQSEKFNLLIPEDDHEEESNAYETLNQQSVRYFNIFC